MKVMNNTNTHDNASIGLVLSGGGAKGAFQVGAWRAICELGLSGRISVISGTSVGAINGAAVTVNKDADLLEKSWLENIDSIPSDSLLQLISSIPELIKGFARMIGGKAFPFPPLVNRDCLELILNKLLPIHWPETAPVLYTTALRFRGVAFDEFDPLSYLLTRFNIAQESSSSLRLKKILASAAIPWGFAPVEIEGTRYIDGGWNEMGGENVPVTPIFSQHPEIKTIIVVRCNSRSIDSETISPPKGVKVIEIAPDKPLPGIMDSFIDTIPDAILQSQYFINSGKLKSWSGVLAFKKEYIENYIKLGYYKTKEILHKYLFEFSELKW